MDKATTLDAAVDENPTKDKTSTDLQDDITNQNSEPNDNGTSNFNQKNQRNLKKRNRKKASTNKKSKKDQQTSHKCHLCDYETLHSKVLKIHSRVHTEKSRFRCEVCTKSFKQKHDLKRHQKIHGDQYPFRCFNCKSGFAEEIDQIEHEKKCNLRQHECHLCKYSPRDFNILKRHIQFHHMVVAPFKCIICKKSFTDESVLIKHLTSHAKKELINLTRCSKCCRKIGPTDELEKHEKHCNRRHYQCYLCEFKVRDSIKLGIHIRGHHTGIKPFLCEYCGLCYTQKANLIYHVNRKHGAKK